MNRAEIVNSFREAKDKPKQIRILAELNACSTADIQRVLQDAGFPPEETRARKAKVIPMEPVKAKKQTSKIPGTLAVLREELDALAKRELEIPAEIEALEAEFKKIADKRRALNIAVDALANAFHAECGGG